MMEKTEPPRPAVGWVLTKRAAARGRGLQSHAAAAGGLLQVAALVGQQAHPAAEAPRARVALERLRLPGWGLQLGPGPRLRL